MADYDVPHWCLYVTIGFTTMNECILVPAIIFFTYKFWKFRHDIFFCKRHPKLVVFYSICMASNPLLRPFMLYQYWYSTEPFWVKMIGYYTTALAFTAAVARFWLTLYDFNYNEALHHQKIQQHVTAPHGHTPYTLSTDTPIDTPHPLPTLQLSNSINNSQNMTYDINMGSYTNTTAESWWITHRAHFGKVKGLTICASLLLTVYCVIIAYLRSLGKLICVIVHLTYLLTVTICGYLATRKISQYRDEFSIYNEGAVVQKPALLFLALFGISIVIEPVHPPLTSIISTMLTFLAASVGISAFTLVTLCWALYQHKYDYQLLNDSNTDIETASVQFNECMQHNEGYYIFFEYLVGEFSVESMDFVTDVLYIKNKFDGNMHREDTKGEFIWPQLPNALYLSQIMQIEDAYGAVVAIYQLYAKEGSVREINISWNERQEIKKKIIIMNKDMVADVDIFDNAVDEALLLMKQAYTRFIHTKEYQIFAGAVEKQKKTIGSCIRV